MELSDAEAQWSEEEVTEEIHSDNEHASTGEEQEDKLVSSEESQEEDDDEEDDEEEEEEVEVNIDHTDFILDSIDKELNALINKTYPTDQSNGQNGHGLTQSPSVMQKDNANGRRRKDGKKRSSLEGTIDNGLGSGVEDTTITEKESSRRRAMEVAEQLLQEVNATDSDNLFQPSIDEEKLNQGPRFDSSNDNISTSSKNESRQRRKRVRKMPTRKRNSSAQNKPESSVKLSRTTGASSDGRSENVSAADGDYTEGVFVQSSGREQMDESDDVSYVNDDGEESLHQSHTDFSRFDGEESLTTDDQTLEDEGEEEDEDEEAYDEDEETHHRKHKTSSLHNEPHNYKEYPQFKLMLETENDIDSMATEDIVHELDISFGPEPQIHPPLPPTPRSSYVYKETSTDNSPRSIKPATQKKTRKKKTLTQKTSKKKVGSDVGSGVGSDVSSGLPEYMYIRKPAGESDIGSDSNYTEHYEPLFCASLVYTGEGFKPGLLPRKVLPNGYIPSDVESVQTEDFERRFRHMMVKQVAGVPIMSFDTVTIPSDLDSVKSGDVRETFQTILKKKKGSKNRSVGDFSDHSDTSDIPRNFEGSFKEKRGNDLLMNGSDEDINKDRMDPSVLRYTDDVRNANGDSVRRGLLHTSNQSLAHSGQTRSSPKLSGQTRQNAVSNGQKSRYPPGKSNSLRALERKHSNRSEHIRQSSRWISSRDSTSTFEGCESVRSHPASSSVDPRRSTSPSNCSAACDDIAQWQTTEYTDYDFYDVPKPLRRQVLSNPPSSSASYTSSLPGFIDFDENNPEWKSVADWVENSYVDELQSYIPDNQPQKPPILPKNSYSDFYKEAMSMAKDEEGNQLPPANDISDLPLEAQYLMQASLGAINPGTMGRMMYNSPVPSEEILMNLGFGGQVMGVPERFMITLRQRQAKAQAEKAKKHVEQVQKMLQRAFNVRLPGQSTSNKWRLSMKSAVGDESTKEIALQELSHNIPHAGAPEATNTNSTQSNSDRDVIVCDIAIGTDEIPNQNLDIEKIYASNNKMSSQNVIASPNRKVPKSSSNNNSYIQVLMEKRKKFRKAATIGSFELLSDGLSSDSTMNSSRRTSLPLQMAENKKAKDHVSPRDRRLKFFRKQYSLPLSLETLVEEDEGQRSKHQSFTSSDEQPNDIGDRNTSVDISMTPHSLQTLHKRLTQSVAKNAENVSKQLEKPGNGNISSEHDPLALNGEWDLYDLKESENGLCNQDRFSPPNLIKCTVETQTTIENIGVKDEIGIDDTIVTMMDAMTQTSFGSESARPSLSSLNENFNQKIEISDCDDEDASCNNEVFHLIDSTKSPPDRSVQTQSINLSPLGWREAKLKSPLTNDTNTNSDAACESRCGCRSIPALTHEDTIQREDEDYGEYFDRILKKITSGQQITESVESNIDDFCHEFPSKHSLDSPNSQQKRLLIPDPGLLHGLYQRNSKTIDNNHNSPPNITSSGTSRRKIGKLKNKSVKEDSDPNSNHLDVNRKYYSKTSSMSSGKVTPFVDDESHSVSSLSKKSTRKRQKNIRKRAKMGSVKSSCESDDQSVSTRSSGLFQRTPFTNDSRRHQNFNYSNDISQRVSPNMYNDHSCSHCCYCPRSCCIVNNARNRKNRTKGFHVHEGPGIYNCTKTDSYSASSSPHRHFQKERSATESFLSHNKSSSAYEGLFSSSCGDSRKLDNDWIIENSIDDDDEETIENNWLIDEFDDSDNDVPDDNWDLTSDESSCPGVTSAFSYSLAQHHQTLLPQSPQISTMEIDIQQSDCSPDTSQTFRSEMFFQVPSYCDKVTNVTLSSQIYLHLLPTTPVNDAPDINIKTQSPSTSTTQLVVDNASCESKADLLQKESTQSRSSSDSFININQGLDSRSPGHSGSKGRPHVWNKYDDVNRCKKSTIKRQGKSVPGRFHQEDELPPADEMLLEEEELTYQVSSLKNELNDINVKKKIALGELKMLLDSVHQNKNDIKKADEIVRQHLEKADAARSELMVLEFQRDQAQRELRDVEEETAAKGRTLQELDRRSSHNSREDLMKLGLSTAEIISLVKERDELKERVRHSEGGMSELERTELQRQLSLSKQELFAEQKNSREKIDKFKEELEEQHHKVEELEYDHEKKVRQYEEKVNDLESKAMKQLTEKNDIIENLEKNQKQEMIKMEKAYAKKEQECNALNKIVREKQEVYDALREKLYGLQEELSKSNETKNQILQEKEQVERNIEMEKQTALLELRDNLLKEKEVELEKLRQEMDTTRQQVVRHQEETFSKQTNKFDEELKEKVDEIEQLKGRLQVQESATRGLGEKLRKEAHDQIKSALKKEREIWEGESKRTLEREMLKKNEEERWTTTQLKADVAKEKQFSSQLQIAMNSLKEELDNLRQENLAMHRQKVEAVSKVREEARQERHNDLEKMREELNQEKTRELEKLKELEKEKDAEIKRLKGELQRNKEKEREVLSDYERSNRSILVELNDECKKTSNLLGTASKKILVGSSTFQKGTVTNGRASSSGSDVEMAGKMQVLSALGNMKGCNDDLRNKFQELRQSLEKQKRINVKASKVREKEKKSKESLESSSSLQVMKERLEKEHSEEMESLHQSLMKLKASESALQGRLVDKDSEMRQIQKSMGLWKEETALKMAKKFEEELNKELDVRMHDSFGHHTPLRRSASSERSASPPIHDASTVKLLRHLQEKVKLLRQENLSLKRGMHSSSHMTADELDTSRELLRKDHNIPKRSHSYGKLP